MTRTLRKFLAAMLVVGGAIQGASCGHDAATTGASEPTPQKTQRVKSGELFDDDSDKIADKYGAINPLYAGKEGKRLDEAGKVNQRFAGEFGKREFAAENYEKKAFWGRKDYTKKVYDADADGGQFLRTAREGGRDAGEGGRVSRASGQGYDRGREFAGRARENSASPIGRPRDAETEARRRVYQQPEVRQASDRRALTIEDTRSLLGR